MADSRYRIVRPLGMRAAVTFAAIRDGSELVVIQRFGRSSVAGVTERILDDALYVVHNSHPNVARARHVDVIDGELVIATEFVDGVTLEDLLTLAAAKRADESQPTLPPPIVVRIVIDVLGGLQSLHGIRDIQNAPVGAVHGAICPRNIVVGMDGVARLVAPFRARPTKRDPPSEAVGYTAPEFLDNAGEYTQRSDLYACGVVLWEGLKGRRLYGDTDPSAVRMQQREGDISWSAAPESAAERLGAVVLRALAFDPALRFRSPMELATAIRRAADSDIAQGTAVAQLVADLAGDRIRARRAEIENRPVTRASKTGFPAAAVKLPPVVVPPPAAAPAPVAPAPVAPAPAPAPAPTPTRAAAPAPKPLPAPPKADPGPRPLAAKPSVTARASDPALRAAPPGAPTRDSDPTLRAAAPAPAPKSSPALLPRPRLQSRPDPVLPVREDPTAPTLPAVKRPDSSPTLERPQPPGKLAPLLVTSTAVRAPPKKDPPILVTAPPPPPSSSDPVTEARPAPPVAVVAPAPLPPAPPVVSLPTPFVEIPVIASSRPPPREGANDVTFGVQPSTQETSAVATAPVVLEGNTPRLDPLYPMAGGGLPNLASEDALESVPPPPRSKRRAAAALLGICAALVVVLVVLVIARPSHPHAASRPDPSSTSSSTSTTTATATSKATTTATATATATAADTASPPPPEPEERAASASAPPPPSLPPPPRNTAAQAPTPPPRPAVKKRPYEPLGI